MPGSKGIPHPAPRNPGRQAESGRTGPGKQGAEQRNSQRKPKKVPWVRRIVSTVILAVVLVALVFVAVKVIGWIMGILTEEHARSTQAATPQPVVINPCSQSDLTVGLTPTTTSVPEGQGFDVAVDIQNVGSVDCSLDLADMSVTLGDAAGTIWTPTACSETWGVELLLGRETSWSTTLTWDGLVYSDCQPVMAGTAGATPSEGTYQLRWSAGEAVPQQELAIQVQ